jgi:hypothetical protein
VSDGHAVEYGDEHVPVGIYAGCRCKGHRAQIEVVPLNGDEEAAVTSPVPEKLDLAVGGFSSRIEKCVSAARLGAELTADKVVELTSLRKPRTIVVAKDEKGLLRLVGGGDLVLPYLVDLPPGGQIDVYISLRAGTPLRLQAEWGKREEGEYQQLQQPDRLPTDFQFLSYSSDVETLCRLIFLVVVISIGSSRSVTFPIRL